MGNPILFVSYNHENTNLADSIQNHRLLNYLDVEQGIKVLYRSKTVKKRAKDGFGVWSPNLFLLDRCFLKVFSFLRPILSFDSFLWCFIAFIVIVIQRRKYDAVAVTYEPYSIYPLSYLLRTFCGVKVISICYDPLADNLFFHQSKIGRKIRLNLEKRIVKTSCVVIVNNELVKDVLDNRYNSGKIELIYLCGSDLLLLDNQPCKEVSNQQKYRIVHCGNIHGMRNLKCLDEMISFMKERIIHLENKLEIIFYGMCSPNEKYRIQQSGNDDVVRFEDPIPPSDLPIVFDGANALFLIDPLENGNFSFPSKLCEYIQSGKDILAFSNKQSPSGLLLRKLGYLVCDDSSVLKMVDYLEKKITLKQKEKCKIRCEEAKQFHPQIIAMHFEELIQRKIYG